MVRTSHGGVSTLFFVILLISSALFATSCSESPSDTELPVTWFAMESNTDESLNDVYGFAGGEVFAVGDNGTIVHYDGSIWTEMPSGTASTLVAVWGAAPDRVYAVGAAGTVLYFDGADWTSLDVGTTEPIAAVTGARETGKVYLVYGSNPVTVLRGGVDSQGQAWWWPVESGPQMVVNDIAAFEPASGDLMNFVLVGDDGAAHLWEAGTYGSVPWAQWFAMDTGTGDDLLAVYGEGANNLIAVGTSGTVVRYSGDVDDATPVWRELAAPAGGTLSAVAARTYNDIFAAGASGRIVHYDRVQFSTMYTGETANLNGVWGGQPGVFAVGDGGTILHYTEPPPYGECPDNVAVTVGEGRYPEITWSPTCAVAKIAVDSDTYGLRWFIAADGNLIESGVVLGTVPYPAVSLGPTGWGMEDGELYRITLMRRDSDGELVVGFHNHVPGDPQATLAANRAARAPAGLRSWHYAKLARIGYDPPTYAFSGVAEDRGDWTHWIAHPVERQQKLQIRGVDVHEMVRDPDTGAIVVLWHRDFLAADVGGTTVVWDRSQP